MIINSFYILLFIKKMKIIDFINFIIKIYKKIDNY